MPEGPEVLAGKVVGLDGTGIAGAHIEVFMEGSAAAPVRAADTGTDGGFRVAGLARASYRVAVAGAALLPAELRHVVPPAKDLAIVVSSRVRIAGRVTDGAAPVAGAQVEVFGSALSAPRPGTTGADGGYAFADLPEGTYAVAARHGPRAALATAIERFGAGPWGEVSLALGPAAVLSGTVTDEHTGEPLADARLILVASADDAAPRRTTADARGAYRFEGVTPGSWLLDADARGYLPPPRHPVEAVPDADLVVNLALARGQVVRGRVVDPQGSGIAGAHVELSGRSAGRRVSISPEQRARRRAFALGEGGTMVAGAARLLPVGELGVMLGPIPYPPPRGATPSEQEGPIAPPTSADADLLTDGDGRFQIDAVPEGKFVARAGHADFADGESQPFATGKEAPAEVSVTLRRGADLGGRVTDERDTPLPGVMIELAAGSHVLAVTFSDDQGRWELHHVAGAVVVRASARTRGVVERDVEVGTNDDGAHFDVPITMGGGGEAGLEIKGQVTDELDRPMAGVVLLATGPGEAHAHAATDAFGRFALTALARGSWTLDLRHAEYPTLRLADVAAGSDDLRVHLVPGGGIRGDAIDGSTRGPLLSFTIHATGPGGADVVRSFEKGSFALRALAPGTWTLTIEAKGYATGRFELEVPAARERGEYSLDRARLELRPGATVAGTVYDEHGDVVAGATVVCGLVRATTDRRGAFRLNGVHAGGDEPVVAAHPRYGSGQAIVPLRSGDEVLTLEIRLVR